MVPDDAYMYLSVAELFSGVKPERTDTLDRNGSFDVMVPTSNPASFRCIYDDKSVGIENLSTMKFL